MNRRNAGPASGDRVEIVVSPYSSVAVGTVATVERVRLNHFGAGHHLYILAGLPHRHFRAHEIRPSRAGGY